MQRRLASVVALAALSTLAACSAAGGPGTSDQPLTYYHDAKPIIDAYCNACHSPGDIGPQDLTTYAGVKAVAGAIDKDIMTGTMPPWPPGPGCNHYVGNRSLPDADKQTLDQWIQQGMKEGDPANAGKQITLADPTHLDRVDLSLKIPAPYTPKLKPDEYRCFIVPWPEQTVKYVTGFRIKPGAKQEVHHVIAYVFPAKDQAKLQQLDDADPGPGYTCFGDAKGPTQDTRIIGVWAAGGIDKKLPDGVGVKMTPGDFVVLQVHYHTDIPDVGPDQSAIELELADTVQRQGVMALYTNYTGWIGDPTGMAIPAGDAHVHHEFAADPTPYMGYLGGGRHPREPRLRRPLRRPAHAPAGDQRRHRDRPPRRHRAPASSRSPTGTSTTRTRSTCSTRRSSSPATSSTSGATGTTPRAPRPFTGATGPRTRCACRTTCWRAPRTIPPAPSEGVRRCSRGCRPGDGGRGGCRGRRGALPGCSRR